MPLTIVIDYDGTIVKNSWPENGQFRFLAQTVLKWLKKRGDILILNTCRQQEFLLYANNFLISHGIEFDYLNENAEHSIKKFGDCRKVTGDLILDDKALFPGWLFVPLMVWWVEFKKRR